MKVTFLFLAVFWFVQTLSSQNQKGDEPFLIQVRNGDKTYEAAFYEISEISETIEFVKIGLQYFEDTNSIKLNGNGDIILNGQKFYIGNKKFNLESTGNSRMGVELSITDIGSESFNISVFMVVPMGTKLVRQVLAYPITHPKYTPIVIGDLPVIRTMNLSNASILDFDKYKVRDVNDELIVTDSKITVLNIFNSGCAVCLNDISKLNKLFQEFQSTEIIFIALSTDSEEVIKSNKALENFKYQLVPSFGETIIKEWEIQSFPSNIIVDKNGRLFYKSIGYVPEIYTILKDKLESLIIK